MNDVLDQLDAVAARVSAVLDALSTRVFDDLVAGRRWRTTDLTIESVVLPVMTDRDSLVAGAGFVAAPDVLADQRYWLEWWTSPAGRPARLTVQADPDAEDFRDYTRLPWFAGPATSGASSLVGPYVDYLCSDEYMLTFAEPVAVAGQFLGVVGVDVRVSWLERHVAPTLSAISPAVLVNHANRVVASSENAYLPGDLVRDAEAWERQPARRIALDLLV